MHIDCQLCQWHVTSEDHGIGIAMYLFHCIRDHWELMEKAHNNPEMLNQALAMATQ